MTNTKPVSEKAFEEAKHPRGPKGQPAGGRFTPRKGVDYGLRMHNDSLLSSDDKPIKRGDLVNWYGMRGEQQGRVLDYTEREGAMPGDRAIDVKLKHPTSGEEYTLSNAHDYDLSPVGANKPKAKPSISAQTDAAHGTHWDDPNGSRRKEVDAPGSYLDSFVRGMVGLKEFSPQDTTPEAPPAPLPDESPSFTEWMVSGQTSGMLRRVATKAVDPNVGGGVNRDKLKDSDFVDPERRRFPIVKAGDVMDAVHSFGRASPAIPFAEFKARVTAIAKRKGFDSALPNDWGAAEKAFEEAQHPRGAKGQPTGGKFVAKDLIAAANKLRASHGQYKQDFVPGSGKLHPELDKVLNNDLKKINAVAGHIETGNWKAAAKIIADTDDPVFDHIIKRLPAAMTNYIRPMVIGQKAFEEAKHPRGPKGQPTGGKFAPKGGVSRNPRPTGPDPASQVQGNPSTWYSHDIDPAKQPPPHIALRGGFSDAVVNSEPFKDYAENGSFGYIHHGNRSAADDQMIERHMASKGHKPEAIAQFASAREGRWLGDALSMAKTPEEKQKQIEQHVKWWKKNKGAPMKVPLHKPPQKTR